MQTPMYEYNKLNITFCLHSMNIAHKQLQWYNSIPHRCNWQPSPETFLEDSSHL